MARAWKPPLPHYQGLLPACYRCRSDEIHVDLWWARGDLRSHRQHTGLGDLVYSVGVRLVGMLDASGEGKLGQGGPDEYGYFWLDTDEPGMAPPEWKT